MIKFPFRVSHAALNFSEHIVDMTLSPIKRLGGKKPVQITNTWEDVKMEGTPANFQDYPFVVGIESGKCCFNYIFFLKPRVTRFGTLFCFRVFGSGFLCLGLDSLARDASDSHLAKLPGSYDLTLPLTHMTRTTP